MLNQALKFMWGNLKHKMASETGAWPLIGMAAGAVLSGVGSYLGRGKQKYDPYGALNPEQRSIVQALGPKLQTSAMADPSSYAYQGQFAAPLTSEEQTTQDRVSRLGALSEEGFSNLMKGEFPEDYYQTNVYQPAMKEWEETLRPAVEEQYAGPGGYWGSARADAVRTGYRDLADTLAAKRSELALRAKEWPITAGPAMANTFQGISGIQQIPRAISQYNLDQKYADFVRTYDQQQQYIDNALRFLGLSTGTTTTKETGGIWPYLMSGVGSALSTYSAIKGLSGQGGGTSTVSDPRGTSAGYSAYLRNQNPTRGIPWQSA